jgi:A118 family predicted phage portal protein
MKYLSSLGYNVSANYYGYIEHWKSWYENYVKKFHEYHDQNGEKRELYKLGMAKRGCEDWSSILFTERDSLICSNANNQTYLDEQLLNLKFNDKIPENIEGAFWSGTLATIVRVKNARLKGKQIIADENTYTELINVTANQIVPLRVDNGKIIDVAFISETTIENKKSYYIEIHELKNNGYVIQNRYIDEQGNEIENNTVAKEYETGSKVPLFSILKPRIVNNIEDNNGMGISVYANAIDQLKACDIAYNNFVKDIELGGKKIFYNKKLVKYEIRTFTDNETGETVTKEIPIYPDDITKQQFQVLGDEMDSANESPLITEHNPDLRTTANEEGNNFALNLYAFKIGLGKGYYRFENGTVVTATQYLGENKDLVGNAKKHRSALNEYTIGIAKAILLLGRLLFKQPVTEEDEITLTDKDGFLISDEELQDRYRQDLQAGLMSKKSYLMKARNMTEQQAEQELAQINEDNPSISDLIGSKVEE